MKNKRARQAFTMIELIFVIIILGILAATALPKFVGIQDDAKISAEKGVAGAVRSGIQLAHGKWLLRQNTSLDWDADGEKETFSTQGYLINLESGGAHPGASSVTSDNVFHEILSEKVEDWTRTGSASARVYYEGPASATSTGADSSVDGNDINKSGRWTYGDSNGTFSYGN
jgi:MSHA pilin protein MshA